MGGVNLIQDGTQWQEKPLLRMLIWSLCLLLVVHLVSLSMGWREERGEEYRRLAEEWLKLQDVSRQTAWPERAMQAERVLDLQRERFWQAPNASQARADVQAWLTERVRLAGVPEAEVSVLLPRGFGKQGTIARIEAQVRGQLEPASFSQLLQDMEAEQRQVSVEFLELNNMLSPRLDLQLSFLFVAAY
ncbi:GspMb/PilO family protein [Pseudomonas aeruginosa]|uniref:GspMb/PilO family protein n=1 Tax=Pseudomonas aeruginosa TaxID=287 RepID=UPI000EACA74D|nr:GspMb/PilO family protein [Pseudomonas aeruginosa]